MDKELIADALKKLKENSPKKNFRQSLDLIINLKGIDLKKTEHNVNMFVALHHDTGRKVSVCALVDSDMESKAKEVCDEVILLERFNAFKKAELKKLANKHNFFIAQASIMPKVATTFGRFLGPKGKMPNPALGSILPPNANIKPLYEKLKRTISLVTKNEPTIKCMVGKEDMQDDALIDNILAVYNSVIQKLPNEKQNVKNIMIKLTMGPAFVIGAREEKYDEAKGKKPKLKTKSEKKEEEKKKEEKKPKETKEETKKQEAKPEARKKQKQTSKNTSKENKNKA